MVVGVSIFAASLQSCHVIDLVRKDMNVCKGNKCRPAIF